MYNGCMGVFDPRPGRAGSLAPGKARFSSVVPSIVFEGERAHILIGAPGATQIAMGVLQVLLNARDFGAGAETAARARREWPSSAEPVEHGWRETTEPRLRLTSKSSHRTRGGGFAPLLVNVGLVLIDAWLRLYRMRSCFAILSLETQFLACVGSKRVIPF